MVRSCNFFLPLLGAIRLFLKLIIFSIIWCCFEMRQLGVIDDHNDMFHYGICLMPPLINQIIEFDSSSSLKRTLVNLLSSYYLPTNFNFFFCMCLGLIASLHYVSLQIHDLLPPFPQAILDIHPSPSLNESLK